MTAPDLGPNTRALLDAARGTGPDAAAIARMRGKIDAAIAAPVSAASNAPTSSTSSAVPSAAPVTTTSTAKLGLLAIAILAATGAGVIATQIREPAAADRIAALPTVDPPAHSLRTVRESAPPVVAASDKPIRVAPHDSIKAGGSDPARSAGPARSAEAGPHPSNVGLAREVELVDRAMAALRGGNARAALLAVRLHASETRDRGQLAEDAIAIEVEALCTLRDPASARRLAAFDARWPASAQRARLTKTCR